MHIGTLKTILIFVQYLFHSWGIKMEECAREKDRELAHAVGESVIKLVGSAHCDIGKPSCPKNKNIFISINNSKS